MLETTGGVVIDYDRIAALYDTYVTADYDVAFFLDEVSTVDGPVLELTSGTGRLSLPLIESGARLTCVDASQGMLDVLEDKLVARGLAAELVCCDVCALRSTRPADLALFPFQSFMEIVGETRQRAALAAIRAALVDGGLFVCTLHNPTIRRAQVDGVQRLVGHFPLADGALVVAGSEQGGHPVVERLQTFERYDTDGTLRAKTLLPMRFELIEHDTFEGMARDAGFEVVELYGHYDRSPFDPEHSPVMIWVLRRGGH